MIVKEFPMSIGGEGGDVAFQGRKKWTSSYRVHRTWIAHPWPVQETGRDYPCDFPHVGKKSYKRGTYLEISFLDNWCGTP